jgi:hypothetical protein
MSHLDGNDDGSLYGVRGESDKSVGVWGLHGPVKRAPIIPGDPHPVPLPPPNAGVYGYSGAAVGVVGESSSGQYAGISALNTGGGDGLSATSMKGTAVRATSSNGSAVVAVSQSQDAINGTSSSSQHAGVSANNSGRDMVFGLAA